MTDRGDATRIKTWSDEELEKLRDELCTSLNQIASELRKIRFLLGSK